MHLRHRTSLLYVPIPYVSAMRYRVVLEYDPEAGHHTATVPGIPAIVCDAKTEKEVLRLVREGIAFYREETASTRRRSGSTPLRAKVVSVDV